MRLANLTWPQAKKYFDENDMVLIAIGSIECHGTHMPLGTDTLIPNRILELIEEKSDVLIAPTIPYGATQYLSPFPGTINLGPDGLYTVVSKVVEGLWSHGARKIVFLNGHGGNVSTLEKISLELDEKGGLGVILNWWLMAWDLNPAWKGGHGGGEETAGVLAVDPSLVDWDALDEMNLHNDVTENMERTGFKNVVYKGVPVVICRKVTRFTNNGWIGEDHPSKASEAWGKEMLQTTADYIADFMEELKKAPIEALR